VLTLLCNWDALKGPQHICQLIQQAANFAGKAPQHGLPIMTSCCLQSHAQTFDLLICQTGVWVAGGVFGLLEEGLRCWRGVWVAGGVFGLLVGCLDCWRGGVGFAASLACAFLEGSPDMLGVSIG